MENPFRINRTNGHMGVCAFKDHAAIEYNRHYNRDSWLSGGNVSFLFCGAGGDGRRCCGAIEQV